MFASLHCKDGTGLTQYCIGQILLETGRAKEAEAKFREILNGNGMGFGGHNLWSLYIDYGVSMTSFKMILNLNVI